MAARRLVFLEFNELCPSLLEQWMDAGLLPNFRAFHAASQVFTGTADVREQEFLEPWIQWYSVHTGLDYYTHQVLHLTDGPSAGHTDVWRALLDAGLRVGNFAGMNAKGFSAAGSFYVPDPWCSTEEPYPAELVAYQRLVLAKVQENSNRNAMLGMPDYLAFVRFLSLHGLSFASLRATGEQLAREIRDRSGGWQRASLLDQLQSDVFLHYWRKYQPDFASIFMNSTAHYQHAYFHLIGSRGHAAKSDPHSDAVLFGYQQMDRFVGRFIRELEPSGALLVLTTALSQQPNPEAGAKYYRSRDIDALFKRLGITPRHLLPVMAQQYSAEFDTAADARQARLRLEAVTFEGKPVFQFDPSPEKTLFFDNGLRRQVTKDAMLSFTDGNLVEDVPYFDLFYIVPHTKSGIHHPDSAIWFKTGSHHIHSGRMPILNIFPTVLDYYSVDALPADGINRSGHSFLPELGIGRYVSRMAAE